MQSIALSDPVFQATFPHRVTPLRDEWLPGLLLRCDEVNHWASRTTLFSVIRPEEKSLRVWSAKASNPSIHSTLIVPDSLNLLDSLAQCLACPKERLLATTYYPELARIYAQTRTYPELLSESFSLHICPACLAEMRLLRRTLLLPHITICPHHRLVLQNRCQCGTFLRLFNWRTQPFTCHICQRDWADLPQIEGTPSRIMLEQKLLIWYEFFFSKGLFMTMFWAIFLLDRVSSKNREVIILEREIDVASRPSWQPLPLSMLVAGLVEYGLSPHDLIADDGLLREILRKASTLIAQRANR